MATEHGQWVFEIQRDLGLLEKLMSSIPGEWSFHHANLSAPKRLRETGEIAEGLSVECSNHKARIWYAEDGEPDLVGLLLSGKLPAHLRISNIEHGTKVPRKTAQDMTLKLLAKDFTGRFGYWNRHGGYPYFPWASVGINCEDVERAWTVSIEWSGTYDRNKERAALVAELCRTLGLRERAFKIIEA